MHATSAMYSWVNSIRRLYSPPVRNGAHDSLLAMASADSAALSAVLLHQRALSPFDLCGGAHALPPLRAARPTCLATSRSRAAAVNVFLLCRRALRRRCSRSFHRLVYARSASRAPASLLASETTVSSLCTAVTSATARISPSSTPSVGEREALFFIEEWRRARGMGTK